MLPLLCASVICDEEPLLTWKWIRTYKFNQLRANFDILYDHFSVSFGAYGWWPVFKVDNSQEIPILGINNGTAEYGDISISTEITRPIGPNFLLIQYIAMNNGDYPHKVSIASWTDVHLFDDDWASIYWYDGNRGLTMSNDRWSNHEKIKLTLVVRDGYGVTNVDNFWFGLQQAYKYHYWDDRKDTRDFTEGDSAFSFGWKDREIYPNQTLKFGVLFGIDEYLKNPPVITANVSTMNYSPNQKVKIPVNIKDFDKNDNVTLYYNYTISNVTTKHTFGVFNTANGLNTDVEINVTLGSEVGEYPLKIWAEDGYGFISNVFSANLLVNEAPVLRITNQIKSKYYKNGAIEVQGTIWDETYAYIYYQIDNSFKFSPKEAVYCNNRQVPFRQVLAIQDKSINFGPHSLKIWAVDQYGSVSKVYSFPFEYVNQNIPEIRINNSEIKTFYENDYIMVVGEVRDRDSNGLLSIRYLPANAEASEEFQFVKDVLATFDWSNFSFIYQVPKMTPGLKHLIFKVIDNTDANSFYAYYYFNYAVNETANETTNATAAEITTTITQINPPFIDRSDIQGDGQESEGAQKVGQQNKEDQNWALIVITASVGVVALAIAIAVIIIYREARKEPAIFNEENAEFPDENPNEGNIENDNPIYGQAPDDPFENDFEMSESSGFVSDA